MANPLSEAEKKLIESKVFKWTDERLAKEMGRDIRTIKKYRESLGIKKGRGGKIVNMPSDEDGSIKSKELIHKEHQARLDKRKEFFTEQLINTQRYLEIQKQFTDDEIEFYIEEWAALCVQFEDILQTEKRQIDELIKTEILGNRILRNIKTTEDFITKLQKEIKEFRKSRDVANDEEAQEQDDRMIEMVKRMCGQVDAMTSNYAKNQDSRNKILNALNARRKDRASQLASTKTNFLAVIEELNEQRNREKIGRYTELLKKAKEKKQRDFRRPSKFPDGQVDCVLLDDESTLPTHDYIEGVKSSLLYHYAHDNTPRKILIAEDDRGRYQFFTHVFSGHSPKIVSTCDEAIDLLSKESYDLICLDYDLGLSDKSERIANHILNNSKQENASILIHSENTDQAERLKQILSVGYRVEKVPFYKLRSQWLGGISNAKKS